MVCLQLNLFSNLINLKLLCAGNNVKNTLQNRLVPKKVEVFILRVRKGRIPVRMELDKNGIDLHLVRCPLCDDGIESVVHCLYGCNKVSDVWNKVFEWWGLKGSTIVNLEELLLGNSSQVNSVEGKNIWQAMIWSCVYLMWKNRNHAIFNNVSWNPPVALSEIQVKSYEWIAKRIKGKSINWYNWLHCPNIFVS
ncbi:uncharacterized protein [Rutidosis leptorrhynchoides]|uniref:uncharacterized protein n=1 Tax=Rutidosis leptorrhynchoides TaxID=125765 RepID=UPI003A98DA78